MQDQFGEEWETICRTENAQTLEIETLRKANAQLTSQVKNLETTLSQINLEHCDLVKQVVMSKIEREELEDELVKCECGCSSPKSISFFSILFQQYCWFDD